MYQDVSSQHILFFYTKNRQVVIPPERTISLFWLGFHHSYYLIVIKQLIARLTRKMSLYVPPFPLFRKEFAFLSVRLLLLYNSCSANTSEHLKIFEFQLL